MSLSKSEIIKIVEKNLQECELNNFAVIGEPNEPIWEDVIVGFGRDDAYFDFLKEDIGDFHWSPVEAFKLGKPDTDIESKNILIMSIGFQKAKNTKELNAAQTKIPTLRWTAARGEWESLIGSINERIVADIEKAGMKAIAIEQIKEFKRETSNKYGHAAKWSHRHAAYICGLGTFGRCEGLITKKGKAMRFTTILIEADLEADSRDYEKYNEWCKMSSGDCDVCIKRCPVGAITKEGHDKDKCQKFLGFVKDKALADGKLTSQTAYGCGLCQCGVPCQDGIPI
jgi:hypothetical protein